MQQSDLGDSFCPVGWWALAGLAALAAFVHPQRAIAQEAERGRQLYEDYGCMACHGAAAEGMMGPALASTTLQLEQVRLQVRNPRGGMPDFPPQELSDGDLDAIYDYLQSLSTDDLGRHPTWRGTDLLNLPTPRTPGDGILEVHFSHRFSDSIRDSGKEGLFGLDSFAFPSFFFTYGVKDRVAAFVGRSANLATWEFGAKVKLLEEPEGLPLSTAANIGGTFLDANGVPNNKRFTAELPIGWRLGDRVSLMAVPIFTTNPDEFGDPDSDDTALALGLGGSLKLSSRLSLDGEWIHNLGGFERPESVDQWQAGVGVRVGGHLFQMMLTNGVFTTPDFMAAGVFRTGVKSNIKFGFNLVRSFKL